MRSKMGLQARFDRLFRDAVDQSCLRMGLLLMFVLDEINLGHTPRNIRLTKRPAHTHTSGSRRRQPPASFLAPFFLHQRFPLSASQSSLAGPCCFTNLLLSRHLAMMSLKSIYERFVSQPSTDDLHDDATLSYISSGTNVSGADAIVKYILRARNDVQVTENMIASHEGHSSLTVEVAADCKFKNGPSWLVPGVQENLLDGMVVKIPLVWSLPLSTDAFRSK
jgi:hypothetical protein